MVDDDPMPLEVLVGLVPLVKRGNRWPTKGQVVLLIGGQVGGGWWTAEDVADYVPVAASTARALLSQLEDERVLLRDPGAGGEAGHPRRYWVEVNPRFEDWRVSWRVPRRVVRQRAVLLADQARTTDLERFIARSYGARYAEINARLWARDKRRQEALDAALSRAIGTRDNGFREGARRAFSGGSRRSAGGSSRVHGRAITRPAAGERVTSPDVQDDLSPVPGPAAPKRERGISIQRTHQLAARRAVCARALPGHGRRRPAVWGSSAELLDRLVADHGVDAVIAACDRIAADVHQVPSFIASLEDLLTSGDVDEGPAPAAGPAPVSRIALEDRHRRVVQRIATYEAEGFPPPDELLAERDKIADALAGYDDNMGDHAGAVAT